MPRRNEFNSNYAVIFDLPRSRLSIGQNSSIVALEATKYKIFDTDLEYILLLSANVKDFVKSKSPIFTHYDLVLIGVARYTYVRGFIQFSAY